MILMSKVFQRLLNSFDAIFRQETLTDPLRDPLQRKSQKRISGQVLVCLPFIGRNTFLPTANDQTFTVFVSKVQNEQGILLFIHWKLA